MASFSLSMLENNMTERQSRKTFMITPQLGKWILKPDKCVQNSTGHIFGGQLFPLDVPQTPDFRPILLLFLLGNVYSSPLGGDHISPVNIWRVKKGNCAREDIKRYKS